MSFSINRWLQMAEDTSSLTDSNMANQTNVNIIKINENRLSHFVLRHIHTVQY